MLPIMASALAKIAGLHFNFFKIRQGQTKPVVFFIDGSETVFVTSHHLSQIASLCLQQPLQALDDVLVSIVKRRDTKQAETKGNFNFRHSRLSITFPPPPPPGSHIDEK